MGVMSCNRKGCENIMCDTYIPEIGYLCWECEKEFKAGVVKSAPETEFEIRHQLRHFIGTEKQEEQQKENEIDVDRFFDQYRRER